MMTRFKSPIRDKVIECLTEHGPQTAQEIAENSGLAYEKVIDAICGSRSKYGTQHFRITAYRRPVSSGSVAPVYTLGPGRDAYKPKMNTPEDRKRIQERYREKNRAIIRARTRKSRGIKPNPFFDILGITLK